MATKKSTKKTASKKAVKKPTTKKVTKKRAYNRKPKPETAPVAEAGQTIQSDQAAQQAHDDIVDALQNGIGIGYGEAQSNASVLREIEVIDLRGLEDKDRFGILCMLDSEGYITSTVESLLKSDNLLVGLEADTLVLNHQNKLVRPASWDEASTGSAYSSRPSIRLNVQIGFSRPEPAYQDVLRIGDAQYVRVN